MLWIQHINKTVWLMDVFTVNNSDNKKNCSSSRGQGGCKCGYNACRCSALTKNNHFWNGVWFSTTDSSAGLPEVEGASAAIHYITINNLTGTPQLRTQRKPAAPNGSCPKSYSICTSIWERVWRGSLRRNDWTSLLSATFKAEQSDFFTTS